jgi:hypothetical protein
MKNAAAITSSTASCADNETMVRGFTTDWYVRVG